MARVLSGTEAQGGNHQRVGRAAEGPEMAAHGPAKSGRRGAGRRTHPPDRRRRLQPGPATSPRDQPGHRVQHLERAGGHGRGAGDLRPVTARSATTRTPLLPITICTASDAEPCATSTPKAPTAWRCPPANSTASSCSTWTSSSEAGAPTVAATPPNRDYPKRWLIQALDGPTEPEVHAPAVGSGDC